MELDQLVPATLAGLAPSEFTITAELQNGTVESGSKILPRSEGGGGYVCCGATKTYVFPEVPASHALSIQLNLTRGTVRSAFLKHDSCVNPLLEVVDAACTAPSCEIAWLTVYDEFYGNMIHTYSTHLAVPFGPTPWNFDPATTPRRAGDWYISIASLPGIAAEYDLHVQLIQPPRPPDMFACSRFSGFCPKDHYHAGLAYSEYDLVGVVSSARATRRGLSATPITSLAIGLAVAVHILLRAPLARSSHGARARSCSRST